MRSLTRTYKKKETAAYKRLSARASSLASRSADAARRILRGARQGITVLVVEDSATPPKGISISYIGLGLGCVGLIGLLALTILFSLGADSASRKARDSGGELSAAREELDRYREGAVALADAYVSLSRPLSEIAGSVQKSPAKPLFAPLRASEAADTVSRFRGEAKALAAASAGLEAAIAPIEELGEASASMSAIKQKVPALWPIKGSLGHLSATYGPNPNPFTGAPYFHKGIDCSNYREGDAIVATADGAVVFAGVQGGYGRSVVISHPNGYFTRYGHMQRIIAKRGQAVKQGQVIGIVGNTGNSTGPHTHYEVMIGDALVDPIDYLWSKDDRKAPEGTVPIGFD